MSKGFLIDQRCPMHVNEMHVNEMHVAHVWESAHVSCIRACISN